MDSSRASTFSDASEVPQDDINSNIAATSTPVTSPEPAVIELSGGGDADIADDGATSDTNSLFESAPDNFSEDSDQNAQPLCDTQSVHDVASIVSGPFPATPTTSGTVSVKRASLKSEKDRKRRRIAVDPAEMDSIRVSNQDLLAGSDVTPEAAPDAVPDFNPDADAAL